ncbi:Sapep family Mn(2+)-dependent dipeptidase [Xiamenia xianingshaonis]|uniref:Sapep family Mn(2+)-dependent dipeptidase n=1 Tax=Xiamenia xianingshaonis TaxID=2682776 RepID=A0A9E6SU33_9ACTN|nr:Sapep family Mn(2+)-dependent dipeptidase [Xiamenia xianingshaonis]NHM14306.1 Sapep family Mn(2+)-dependent dipeptidase [Xiamenia xianingshaonis]QTU84085.1 Sapep family Mn(2+)-dependent dipeptidase [Xiamenia xianingshaonis]
MVDDQLLNDIDAYLDENWESMVRDVATLVRIPSFEELDKAEEGAPFGPGPRQALTAVLDLAAGMGFETHDCEGYIGYADFPGESDTQLGIIGHMDVVPAGPGWNFPAYDVTRKEGYLIGRGCLDDKGPSVVALWAMKYWKDRGEKFPCTIRFLFGANEESGMGDVAYYRKHYADPAFLFTPDAEFPVCYGEKGGYDAVIKSEPMPNRRVRKLVGGAATNAVPGQAEAVVEVGDLTQLPGTDRVAVELDGNGCARLVAAGKSAHASMPEEGVNAIALIVDFLLENDLLTSEERAFFEFESRLLNHTDGSGVGLKTSDEYFGALTIVGGTVKVEDDRFVQTVDSRFPTSIDGDEITAILTREAGKVGASVENTLLMVPFLVKPDTPAIQALLDAYNEVTGEDAKPFTMGGGTYAREFASGASFGPERPWIKDPDWVGSMHGPDEGVSEELLRASFCIYAVALKRLMDAGL